jgi:lysophospholipase L1-like esterase
MRKNNPELAQESYDTLLELIRDLKADGISVALFTAPYCKAYNKQFPKVWQTRLGENARRLSRATGASYYDFSRKPEFSEHAELFADADHLNIDGKRLFSRIIAELPEVRAAR